MYYSGSLNFDEATLAAKKIHPQAQAVLNDGKWVFVIVTDYDETLDFPEDLKETPAWEAYSTAIEGSENGLTEWGKQYGHDELPLLSLIRVFNLEASKNELIETLHKKLLAQAGIPLTKEEIFASSDSIFHASAWLEFRNQACLEADEQIEAAIDKIYGLA